MSATDLAIEVSALTKAYGDHPVLEGVDLAVPRGTVFALLGPNGAGKTTTVRIMATLMAPDTGVVRVAGFDVVSQRRQVRRRISLTGQYAALDEMQTGHENLLMMGRLQGLGGKAPRRAEQLLEQFDLVKPGSRRVATYSGGMRRRLDLAASLVGDPEVIFLDEPTTGLDPRSRQSMWATIAGLAADGITVLLTTQYLDEADQLADHIAVLHQGRVVANGTPASLKAELAGNRLDMVLANALVLGEVTQSLGERCLMVDPNSLSVGVSTDGSANDVRATLDSVDPDGSRVVTFSVHSATLDDVFMNLTRTKEEINV